jgi:hypothetical protein
MKKNAMEIGVSLIIQGENETETGAKKVGRDIHACQTTPHHQSGRNGTDHIGEYQQQDVENHVQSLGRSITRNGGW